MSINNLKHLSTDELVKQFKAATLNGKPPQELVSELKNRPGIAFINATDSAEVTLEKARAATLASGEGYLPKFLSIG